MTEEAENLEIAKTVKDIRDMIEVRVFPERTFITVVAVHNDPHKNFLNKISCKRGVAIGGYVHDTITDTYHIECHDYKALGYISASYGITVPGAGYWVQRIPMPEVSIRRYLTRQQRADLRIFKATYKSSIFTYQFMQLIDCF